MPGLSTRSSIWVLCFLLWSGCQSTPEPDPLAQIADEMVAYQARTPYDLARAYPDLEEADWYALQRRTVARKYGPQAVAGYKAALTSAPAQAILDTDHPASGYLLRPGWLANGDTVRQAAFTLPFIELEIGYFLRDSLLTSPESPEMLRSLVGGVAPVIELPDLGFPSVDSLNLTNFVAHNAASRQFMVGEVVPLSRAPDLNNLTITLYKDGVELGKASGADALGDQWNALNWLIDHRLTQGDPISKRHLLITGSLGQLFPFQAGRYRADYGALGSVEFVIQ